MFVSWEVKESPAANANEGFVLTNQGDCSNGGSRLGQNTVSFPKPSPGAAFCMKTLQINK